MRKYNLFFSSTPPPVTAFWLFFNTLYTYAIVRAIYRDQTSYTSGSVPWDVENKFGESKMQDTEIISVILATAHAYLNAGV